MYIRSTKQQLANLMAHAAARTQTHFTDHAPTRTLATITDGRRSSSSGRTTSSAPHRSKAVTVTGRSGAAPCPRAATRPSAAQHSNWLELSSQLMAQGNIDVQGEIDLVTSMCPTKWKAQKNKSARQVHNQHQQQLLDSLTRAQRGEVSIQINAQRPLATAQLAELQTREQYIAFTQKQIDLLTTEALSDDYLANRLSGIKHWRVHCHEGHGLPFIRIEWLTASHDHAVLWHEENLMISFFGHMIFRLRGGGPINMITHVKQFMLSVQIPSPPFLRLKKKMSLYNHSRTKKGKVRKLRPFARAHHIKKLSLVYKRQMFDSATTRRRRILIGVKRCIMLTGFRLAMRVVSVARGAAYDHSKHWCIKHFHRAGVMSVQDGGHIIVRPTQRKFPSENARRPVPIAFDKDDPLCIIAAYRDLRKIDPVDEYHHRNHCLFRINTHGHAPSASWFCEEFKADMKTFFPDAAHGLCFSSHVLRRGAISNLVAGFVLTTIIDQIAGNADHSTQSLYTDGIVELILRAQRQMGGVSYTSLQDDVILPMETDSDVDAADGDEDLLAERDEAVDSDDLSDERESPPQAAQAGEEPRDMRSHFEPAAAPRAAPAAARTAARASAAPARPPAAAPRRAAPSSAAAHHQKILSTKKSGAPCACWLCSDAALAVPEPKCMLARIDFRQFHGGDPEFYTHELCRRYQFKWYHPYATCRWRSGHRCFYCGADGHGGRDCDQANDIGVVATKRLMDQHGIPAKQPR